VNLTSKRSKSKEICYFIDMKKDGLVEAVMQAANLDSKRQAVDVVDAVFETITKTMGRGEEVAITGFGTFKVTKRAARTGRNPATGESIQIPASIQPKFKAGKGLKEAVN
jgi:DNA-binding protein HU-beta